MRFGRVDIKEAVVRLHDLKNFDIGEKLLFSRLPSDTAICCPYCKAVCLNCRLFMDHYVEKHQKKKARQLQVGAKMKGTAKYDNKNDENRQLNTCDALKRSVSSLKEQLKKQKVLTQKQTLKNEKQKEKCNQLEIEVERLTKLEQRNEENVEILKNNENEANILVGDLRCSLELLREENDRLRSSFKDKCTEYTNVHTENQKLNSRFKEFIEDNNKLHELLENSKKEKQCKIEELKDSHERFQQERKGLQTEKEILCGKMAKGKEEENIIRANLSQEKNRLRTKLAESENANKQLSQEMKRMQDEITSLKQTRSRSTYVNQIERLNIQIQPRNDNSNLAEDQRYPSTSYKTKNNIGSRNSFETHVNLKYSTENLNGTVYVPSDDEVQISD
jgi:DNA repair exonuclease SbcCD ATPase subunit